MDLKDTAEILKAVAWPMVVGAIFFTLRGSVRDICMAFSAKIARASRLKVSKTGLELVEEVVRQSVASGGIPEGKATDQSRAEFDSLVTQYNELSDPAYQTRVATRTEMADRLGKLALVLKLPRADLAASRSEGELVALATVAILEPKSADLALLDSAAGNARFRFTRYRIGLALIPTLNRPGISRKMQTRVADILTKLEGSDEASADGSLQRLIDRLRAMLPEPT